MFLIYTNTRYLTLRQVLKNEFKLSSRLITKLKKNKCIFLNESNDIYIDIKINISDIIKVDLDFKESSDNIIPTKMDLDIIYEDEAFIIVNKPPFIPVHPSMDHFTDSLSNGIKFYFEQNNICKKIRPVNRLDRNTSGIVIFAKNEYVQECLVKQMSNNIFSKTYIAVCNGHLDSRSGVINAPIAREENSIIKRCISPLGAESITEYDVLEELKDYSIVKIHLKTGRTHQIRVHFSYIGHPLLGDDLYGTISPLINRQALHSYQVSFIHPISKETLTFTAPIPEDLKKVANNVIGDVLI